jgi:predicted ATPase
LHQLVEAELLYQQGSLPQATYTFKHALIQDAAYQSLLRSTRQQFHQHIAQVLAEQFPETAETQPEILAHHYTAAGLSEHAIGYWQRAGRNACERSAHVEAIAHLTQGLALLTTLPETSARAQQELDVQITLAQALSATKSHGAPEVEQTYARARALCAQVGETPQLFPALWGLWRFYHTRGALPTVRELGDQLLQWAEREADPTHCMEAHAALGQTLLSLGEYAAARAHLEQGIARTDQTTQRALVLHHGEAPGVRCLGVAADTLWCLGYPAQAMQRSQEALALAQALTHPYSLATAEFYAIRLHHYRSEVWAIQGQADALLTLATAQQFPQWMAHGTFWQGWILAMQGQGAAGLVQMQQGLDAVLATGQRVSQPRYLVLLAEAMGYAGQIEEGLRLLAEALTAFKESGRGRYARRGISAPGRAPVATGHPGCGPGRSLLRPRPRHCPPSAGQILGATRRHEPGPPVAAAGQAHRGPSTLG